MKKISFLFIPLFLLCILSCKNFLWLVNDEKGEGYAIPERIPKVKEKTDSLHYADGNSFSIDMIEILNPDSIILGENVEDVTKIAEVPPFRMAKFELSYNIWYKVYSWATSEERGEKVYAFENPGSEGAYSSGGDKNPLYFFNEGGFPKTEGMPVAGVSWRDAVVWCNALNEMLGLEPVYCADEQYQVLLRNAVYETGAEVSGCPLAYSEKAREVDMTSLAKGNIDNPYVNKNSRGYRLPYDYEWEYAARKCSDGSFIPGTNAPGDKYGPSKTRSSKPTVIEQIKGITEVKQPSKEINAFGWGFNKRKGGTKFDSDAYAASNSAGPEKTAAGWDDSSAPDGMTGYVYRMHRQGGKQPTELGFYDLAGNAYEWVFDYGASYDWKYDVYTNRTLRGHTFQWDVSYFESAYRYIAPPYVKLGGLRLAQNL